MYKRKITAFMLSLALTSSVFSPVSGNAAVNRMKTDTFTANLYSSYGYTSSSAEMTNSIYSINMNPGSDKLVIPSEYEGVKTGSVSSSYLDAKYIVLPKDINSIGRDMLSSCSGLECVVMPDNITETELHGCGSDVTVIGSKKSFAEYYARSNGNKFRCTGDMNGDGEIKVSDLVGAVSYVVGKDDADEISRLAADFDHDGKLGVTDIINLKKALLEDDEDAIIAGKITGPDLYSLKRTYMDSSASSLSRFAADISSAVLLETSDEKGEVNTVYSPLSLYMAMSVLTECTDTETLDELLTALHADSRDELRKINQDIFSSMYFDKYSVYNRMNNSVWLDQRYNFNKDVLDIISDYYFTESYHRDLQLQETADDISAWIYENTSGKLKPELSPIPDEILKIVNTVTFKEKWAEKFGYTEKADFTAADGSVTECDMMKDSDEDGLITETDKYIRYSRMFEDGYRMNFVLPAEGMNIEELVSDSDALEELFSSEKRGSKYNVNARIPKFDIKSKFNLIDAVNSLGISRIFKDADFTPLLGGDIDAEVGEITQEAVITMDEEGCEAAAYTIISVKECSALVQPLEIYNFNADRPFFYYISDKNNTPLFAGIINNPNEE